MSSRLAQTQFGKLKKQGGFSVNPQTGGSPKVGYMVAIPGAEEVVRSQNVAPAHIDEFIKKHGEKLSKKGAHVGAWDSDGKTYFDVSQQIKPDRNVARKYGSDVADADARTSAMDLNIARNQIAAYDLKRGKDLVNKDHPENKKKS